ncbi:MAG: AMP-binding protein, partial [Chloroflexota bacterium]|nr:AMP-binding protein [Chloroflexota bacterium]
ANHDLERLKQVWRQLEQPIILTDRPAHNVRSDLAHQIAINAEQIVAIDTLRDHAPDLRHYPVRPDDVAFFSLTSGSTGTPKCIPLTHRTILTRVRAANHYCSHTRATVTLNWLPLEHIGPLSDMHLRAVALGSKQIHVPRAYVAGNLLNWLTLLDRYRATYSASPNFGYGLTNNALEKTDGA